MEKINYFNYCAVIMLSILLISTILRKMTNGHLNRVYIYLVIAALVSTLFDMGAIACDNFTGCSTSLTFFMHTGYLISHNLTAPLYLMYLIVITDTEHKFQNNVLLKILLTAPLAVILTLLLTNPFTKIMFYCDPQYTRGKCFGAVYICSFFYVTFSLYHTIKYGKVLERSKFLAIFTVFTLVIISVIIQFFYPNYPVEMFANAVGLLFISMFIQKPEDNIDTVTGLGNYSFYADVMRKAFANKKSVDVILINISNYMSLKDILGYDEANSMLFTVAEHLKKINKQFKYNAEIYYLDNGRYRLTFNGEYKNKISEAAETINSFFKSPIEVNHMDINLITYVCTANCPEDIDSFQTLMFFGNDFHKKNTYTGDVIKASDIMKKKRYDIMHDIDSIIDKAIAQNKFSVYYQPIFSIEQKRFQSAEALLRLYDDKYGFISPELFIPAAEKSGAIHKIGKYVLEEVCRFISSEKFKDLGIDYIEINLSVVQCMQVNLANEILDVLNKYNVPVNKINLEITETAAANAQNIMSENLNTLSEAGIKFSLDDFGTGYSNMRRVASLPLSIVKLDKTFANMEESPKMDIVLKNTIKMLKAMNMKIVVEGIETESLVNRFSDLKCEYIQGYYYSKPVPEKDFVEFIRSNI